MSQLSDEGIEQPVRTATPPPPPTTKLTAMQVTMHDQTDANSKNNSNNNNNKKIPINDDNNNNSSDITLTPSILAAYRQLALERNIPDYDLETQPIAGIGENAYGTIMQVSLIPTNNSQQPIFHSILKIAPKSPARRQHMRVVDFYEREVFMYSQVLSKYAQLNTQHSSNPTFVPEMYYQHLNIADEFIIFEDLTKTGYTQNARTQMPTFELVNAAIQALAQLHAMSFVLQARQPEVFASLVENMQDNLFDNIGQISVEFGRYYVWRTRSMLLEEPRSSERKQLTALCSHVALNFKEICLRCVNGRQSKPYAVICHGDFWNNNILYKSDPSTSSTTAKLIDFQMSRYAPPVLDLVHYLFACTEQHLRDAHFNTFMTNYYTALAGHITAHQLNPQEIYPHAIFTRQLRDFGIYGFCMSAFAMPFFISNTSELFDLDVASEAIQNNLSSSSTSNASSSSDSDAIGVTEQHSALHCDTSDAAAIAEELAKCRQLVENYDMLTERTIPIFKRRMLGILTDLAKYNMIEHVLEYD